MGPSVIFDAELIRRYDTAGPRYTSYPTAVQFTESFSEAGYRSMALATNGQTPARPLSLYFHIPFCDTLCFYCGCSKVVTKNRARAQPYLDRLYAEVALQGALFDGDRPVTQLHWGGGTPTFISHDQMRQLMDVTRHHFRLMDDDSGEYSIEIDPREVNGETVALLRSLGFNRLSLGVQDFDPRVQKAVNRIQPEAVTLSALEHARLQGFKSVNVDLIYGLPLQSVASFACTLERVIAASPDRLSVFNYAHLPKMFKPQRRINESDLPSAAEKLEILGTTIQMLSAAGYVYIGMDHFAKPDDELAVAQREGTLYRNFQGYSTQASCDLIGMGVTSIGMVGDCYAQNAKEMDAYCAGLDAGRLAVFRGARLDADDRLRRHVITQLICQFQVDKGDVEDRFGIDFDFYFADELARLGGMADDGLVQLGARGIQVTPAGRLVIRNVCMTFDRYLSPAGAERFSKVI